MKIRFKSLTIQTKKSREILDLDHQVVIFHGQISAGKSSILRMIRYCLGGDLEMTIAITQEVISVNLTCEIGDNTVLLERKIKDSNLTVSWKNKTEELYLIAPTLSGASPIYNDNIYNLSDLIFALADLIPLKVRRNKSNEFSPLVRLSMREIMWYCYLDQDHLDSSFYRLEIPFKKEKSKDVMKYILGFYSNKLNELELLLESELNEKAGKSSAVQELVKLIKKLDLESTESIENDIVKIDEKLKKLYSAKAKLRESFLNETNFAKSKRQKAKKVNERISELEEISYNLTEKINEQLSLKSELISSKFKLAKSKVATNILSGVNFVDCPQCGQHLKKKPKDQCHLCGNDLENSEKEELFENAEAINIDLNERINDLDLSIKKHEQGIFEVKKALEKGRDYKKTTDSQLSESLNEYESKYVTEASIVQDEISTLEERKKNKIQLKKIPQEITILQKDLIELEVKIEELRSKVLNEKNSLSKVENYLNEIEDKFLEYLIEVDVPGVSTEDKVVINRKNFSVDVHSKGEEFLKWNFYNAGSGGKKTLFNVCYALAIHTISANNSLPLPKILMIDTPMKNIGEDVNQNLFQNFYNLLYKLAANELKEVQFILVDKELNKPDDDLKIDLKSRFMTPDNDKNPPLIKYYRGS